MVITVRAAYLALVLTVGVVLTSEDPDKPIPVESPASKDVSSRDERDISINEPEGKEHGRIISGDVRTTTLWSISIATSTAYFSCLSGAATVPCTGRRKRKRRADIEFSGNNNDMDGSITNVHDDLAAEAMPESDRDEKLYGFTVWTAITSSTTVTVVTTDTRSTVRLSYFCTAAFAQFPPAVCG